jgi:pyruvate formate lyase activating enzyme
VNQPERSLRGLIFDLQGFSVHDGPGCRTAVFFSGCPLRCGWCANPEGFTSYQETLFVASRCRHEDGCTECLTVCPDGIQETGDPENPLQFDRKLCQFCATHPCDRACPQAALRRSARWISLDQLDSIVRRDRQYWGPDGGITFTGGEPFAQHEFVREAAQMLASAYVQLAIETSAEAEEDVFLSVLEDFDWAFIDIKHMSPQQHRAGTGKTNERIMANLTALAHSRWAGRLLVRVPLIPGYNDGENLAVTAKYLRELGLCEVNLLPFHRLGTSKWSQLGLLCPFRDTLPPTAKEMKKAALPFVAEKIACYLGSDTPF